MKPSILLFTFLITAFSTLASQQDNHGNKTFEGPNTRTNHELNVDSIQCEISGTVIDRPNSKEAIIIEDLKDQRVNKHIRIPIINGKYSYTLRDDYPRTYSVFFDDEERRGSIRIRDFYTGNGYINIISHNEENEDDDKIISDIEENKILEKLVTIENLQFKSKLDNLFAKINSLHKDNRAYSSEVAKLIKDLEDCESEPKRDSIQSLLHKYFTGPKDKYYSKEYLKYDSLIKETFQKRDSIERIFITENPSLVGLFKIKLALQTAQYIDWMDIEDYKNIFEKHYLQPMHNHPYIEDIKDLIQARKIVPGNKYPDYKVTRENGTTEQIKNLISGKIAVIDLWASWCGPCRRHSIQLIPLYEKYKDKGFTVVAIAREDGSCDKMNKAMKKDDYPWESFVDLNDRDKIWSINYAGNSGGKIILVNSDGIIEAVDTPIEEIEVYLNKIYGF